MSGFCSRCGSMICECESVDPNEMGKQMDKINYADYCALRNERDKRKEENAQLTKKLAEYQAAILKYENVNQADLYFPEEELATLLSAEYQRGIEEGKRMAVPEGIVSIDAGFDYLQCVHTPWLKLYFASGTDCNELWVKRDKAKAMLAASPKPKEE